MALLDSFIAFALTLAALATVVTIIMEIITRVAGLKAARQVELFGELFDNVIAKQLPGAERWDVIRTILQSRLSSKKMADKEREQTFFGTAAGAIYDDVSVEHVLRRLTEIPAAAAMIRESEEALKAKLGLIARKYEEYCSALGADFKRNALRRSIWIGIALAFVMNADGVRLLTAYLHNEELRTKVVETLQPSDERQAPSANEAVDSGGAGAGNSSVDNIEERMAQVKSQIAVLDGLNLPIGTAFFPQCYWFFNKNERAVLTDPHCQRFDERPYPVDWKVEDYSQIVVWFLKVLVTGILIGLGAPFWYDVAKRLATVREAFKGKGSAETSNRGADTGGEHGARSTLINEIVQDIKAAIQAGLADPATGGLATGGQGGGATTPPPQA